VYRDLFTGQISVQRCILSVYMSNLSTEMYFICLEVRSQYRDVFYLFTGQISVQRCILSVYMSNLSSDVFCLFTGQISVRRCILSVYRSDLSTEICLHVRSLYKDLFTGQI
jgi:hypothetical protein